MNLTLIVLNAIQVYYWFRSKEHILGICYDDITELTR